MKIVLGLGNPGERYGPTRHNLGFRVVDRLARRLAPGVRFEVDPSRRAWRAAIELGGESAILAKPRTYMNRSGAAALALCRLYELSPQDLLVVYDDADLALGRVRLRATGRAAGHRGVQSLIDVLRTDAFPRVKLGVKGPGRDDAELADYVLEEFEADERPVADALVDLGADAVEAVFEQGFETAMNRFNGRSVIEGGEDQLPEQRQPRET